MIRPPVALFALLFAASAILVTTTPADAGRCFIYSDEIGMVCDGRTRAEPEPFHDAEARTNGLLAHRTYAYLQDDINIYPQPSTSAPPLYNVGQGFLYVTIQGQVEAEGQSWYIINPGEYARAEDIRVVSTPEFHGVEVTVQPERPFGWVVEAVRPSSRPDGEPEPIFAKLERFDFFQVYDAVAGAEEWLWYDIGGGRWVRQTFVSLVDPHAPPAEVAEGEFWVEVDLYEQTFAAYEDSRMVYAGLISSGLNRWPTHEGIFQVFSRHMEIRMSGAEGKVDYYNIEDVPYTMYFDRHNEIALHGAYWHDRYGYKHSHGCVNMPPRDAEWIYYWSENGPNDLWVWVHTSDPNHYFDRFAADAPIAEGSS
jgi:L,D-transpeptidase catalytic domain